MNPTLCDHLSQRTYLDAVRWCTNCGAIRLTDPVGRGDAEWTNPGEPGDASAYFDTLSGRRVCLLDPRPEDYDLEEVAHQISMQPRFNGSMRRFYGVGEHSVNVGVGVAYREGATGVDGHPIARGFRLPAGADPRRFWGALLRAFVHDGPEAMLGDCISPLKQLLPTYRAIERLHARALHTSLGFGPEEGWVDVDRVIAEVDKQVCAVEQHVLRGKPPCSVPGVEVCGWDWEVAKGIFLDVVGQAQRGFEPYREAVQQ